MNAADIASLLQQKFGDRITAVALDKPGVDPSVTVDAAALLEVCRFLRDEPSLRFEILSCISGVDYLEIDPKKAPKAGFDPHLEVVYHLQSLTHNHRFTIKVVLPRWRDNVPGQLPELPSVCSIWNIADWHEREVYDLCGVWFTGHPNLTRILLAEDWVGHPLRKDYEFPLEYHGIRGR